MTERSGLVIRPYGADDEARLIDVWNRTMWADPMTVQRWRSDFLLDPNFRPDECLLAEMNSAVVGFAFGMSAKGEAEDRSTAWIVGFGVLPPHRRQGIATSLLAGLEEIWRAHRVRRIAVGPYVPSYLAPGVDVAAYQDAMSMLDAFGASERARPLSMRALLTGYRVAPGVDNCAATLNAEGISIEPATSTDILPLLQFAATSYPHWQADMRRVLHDIAIGDDRAVTLFVARDQGDVIGFSQSRAERFGPFGVDPMYQGRGVGGVLLARTLVAMRARGYHAAWFLWTSDRTARLYQRHGFEEVRRFSYRMKELNS